MLSLLRQWYLSAMIENTESMPEMAQIRLQIMKRNSPVAYMCHDLNCIISLYYFEMLKKPGLHPIYCRSHTACLFILLLNVVVMISPLMKCGLHNWFKLIIQLNLNVQRFSSLFPESFIVFEGGRVFHNIVKLFTVPHVVTFLVISFIKIVYCT